MKKKMNGTQQNTKDSLYAKSNVLIKRQNKTQLLMVAIWKIKNKTRHAKKQCDWSKSITQNTKIQKLKW